jgi:hypothetical protein
MQHQLSHQYDICFPTFTLFATMSILPVTLILTLLCSAASHVQHLCTTIPACTLLSHNSGSVLPANSHSIDYTFHLRASPVISATFVTTVTTVTMHFCSERLLIGRENLKMIKPCSLPINTLLQTVAASASVARTAK